MPNTPKRQIGIQLAATDGAIFTVPAGKKYVLSEAIVINTDGAQRRFRMHHVPTSGSSTATNALFYDTPVKAGQVLGFGRGWVFEEGDMLRGLADVASKVSVTVYYTEVS